MAFHPSTEEVGIDVGLKRYAVLSDGSVIDNPRISRNTEQKIKDAHRRLHRRKRGSHRRKRAKQELSRLYRKTRHRRQDFLHKASRKLVDQYATLVFEGLQIADMVARPKPKQDEETGAYLPNGATAKSGLNTFPKLGKNGSPFPAFPTESSLLIAESRSQEVNTSCICLVHHDATGHQPFRFVYKCQALAVGCFTALYRSRPRTKWYDIVPSQEQRTAGDSSSGE
jgi:hypothetical protein